MKNFHRATAFIIGATLIMSSSVMATENVKSSNISNQVSSKIDMDSYIKSEAKIKSIIKEDGNTSIIITPSEENAMDIMLKIYDDTKIDLASLKEGDTITAIYEKAMTRSIPPQTNAIEVSKLNISSVKSGNSGTVSADGVVIPEVSKIRIDAVITSINDGENKSLLVENSEEKSPIVLNIADSTIIMKADGTPLDFSDLKSGDKINVVHNVNMTASLPPQVSAYTVIVSDENVAVPQYIKVKQIVTENDLTTITSDDGNFIVMMNKDTEVVPFKTKNVVKASDIDVNSEIFVWSDIMTLSIPAQMTANKVMILPETTNVSNEEEPAKEPVVNQVLQSVKMNAIITEITNTDEKYKSISVINKNNENSEVVLNIGEDTIIINADGTPLNLSDLKKDDKISVAHSPAMTFSLPPQTYAYAIIVNNDDISAPNYIEVSEIKTDENGQTKIYDANESIIISVDKDTEIVPYKTKNIVTAKDILENEAILVWYDIVLESYPAQTTADKIMILPKKQENTSNETSANTRSIEENQQKSSSDIVTNFENIIINDEILNLENKKVEVINNHNMIPFRVVAEKLGFTIEWDNNTSTASLDDGTVKTSVTVGKDSYNKQSSQALGLTQPISYGIAPEFIEGNLYVPAEIFNLLYSNPEAVTVSNGTLNVNVK